MKGNPTVRPTNVSDKSKLYHAGRLLRARDSVESAAVDDGPITVYLEIELEDPTRVEPEVMSVLAEEDLSLGYGCLDSGMNPFRAYP